MRQEWRPVVGYEGLYEVSSSGQVRSLRSGIVLKPTKTVYGYLKVTLYLTPSIHRAISIHSLVLEAFVGKRPHGLTANHKNSIRTDNHVENLEWLTMRDNAIHREKAGRGIRKFGSECNLSKLTEAQVMKIISECAKTNTRSIAALLAKQYGVSSWTIRLIRRGKMWAHIPRKELEAIQ